LDDRCAIERDQVMRIPHEQLSGTTMIGLAAGAAALRGRLAAPVGSDRPVAFVEGAAANVLGFVTAGLAK
jgi:uncharacterized membrane protein